MVIFYANNQSEISGSRGISPPCGVPLRGKTSPTTAAVKSEFMKQDIRDYKRLIGFVKPHMWVLALAFIFMLIYSILNGLSPTALIPVVDNIMRGSEITIPPHVNAPIFITVLIDKINALPTMKLVTILLVGTLIYFLLRNLFDFFHVYLMNDVSQRVIKDIKDAIYKKLLGLSMYFYSKNPTAKLMSRITYDASIIRDSISTGLLDLILRPLEIISHFTVVVCIVIFFGIPLRFVFTSIILFPCILFPAVIISRRLRKITTETQEKMGDINMTLFEIITGMRIVKAFSMQKYEYNKFSNQNIGFYKLAMKAVKRINAISPINEFTSAIYFVTVMYLAYRQITAGTLSWGSFVVFLSSVLLMLKPVKRLSKVYAVLQQSLAAATRIFEILDTEESIKEKEGARELPGLSWHVSLKGVWFKYDKDCVLKDVNLDIKKGEIVAIVGPSGTGKTTLINLIPRFYDPSKGSIKIDDIDLRDVTLKSLRSQIGIVTQEMLLFNDTVTANIAYGDKDYSRERIVKAAKVANAHDFIMNLPRQYDTIVGERGFKISGGERQRLAIARAIFKNPPILILDEATSQLDTESERYVQEAIDRLMEGRTVFVIAHRLSTIKHTTRIVVLDKGKIIDTGTHKELMERGGLYKRLYDMQFRDEY
ncbi:MAG: ATP-binding cassette domain-containing protein [Candidatus Omnitrophota bacterium]|nr:MAG: ATP-binding cassette domain-containing protein [Candidatus Omnitrophota bacterium]